MHYSSLIVGASWEERFPLGCARLLADHTVGRLEVFYHKEYESRYKHNLEIVREVAEARHVVLTETPTSYESASETWHALKEKLTTLQFGATPLIDISTMTREMIWLLLDRLARLGLARPEYVYHKPREYGEDWLTADPGKPRLVLKRSGISKSGSPTTIVATTGYDPDRIRQLLWAFEPRRICLLVQAPAARPLDERSKAEYEKLLGERPHQIELRKIDVYDGDCGFATLNEAVRSIDTDDNLLLASFGPKLSAVALHRVQQERPETGLVYVPASQYNENYSQGIGQSYQGVV
jgi:hypothetical protein